MNVVGTSPRRQLDNLPFRNIFFSPSREGALPVFVAYVVVSREYTIITGATTSIRGICTSYWCPGCRMVVQVRFSKYQYRVLPRFNDI